MTVSNEDPTRANSVTAEPVLYVCAELADWLDQLLSATPPQALEVLVWTAQSGHDPP